MPATLFDQLTDAFRTDDPQTTRGLLERAAKESADALASGDRARLAEFCDGLAAVGLDTEALGLTPEQRELRGYLAALAQLARAALERASDLEAVPKIEPVDYRPAILSCIRKEGAARHDAVAQALAVSPRALEQPVRSLLAARTITATVIEGAQCYALTPLGYVVARRLEERAAATHEPQAEAPTPDRPLPFQPPPPPSEPQPPAPEAAGTDTEELPAVEPAFAADELLPFDTGIDDAAVEEVPAIALELEESGPEAEDATVTEDIAPGEAPAAPAAEPPPRDTARALARRRQHVKVRVAVLYGGISAERHVSLRSGEAVGQALRDSGYQVEMIDAQEATLGELSPRRVDVAFVALRGTFGEDGGIQSVLDALGVPYTGSGAAASRLASDKIAAKRKLRVAGVPTPAFVELDAGWPEPLKLRAASALGFPAVLKPTSEGSSLGVAFADSRQGLAAALDAPFKFDTHAFAEQYCGGRELTVGILDGELLPTIELVYDGPILTYAMRQAPGAVTRVVEPELPPDVAARVRAYALAASDGLGCRGCARVDLRLDDAGVPHVLEVNPVPPLAPDGLLAQAAAAAGTDFAALCERLLDTALPAPR